MANPLIIIDSDPAGIVATHAPRVTLPVLAAPVPDEKKPDRFNTLRQQLIVIGCLRLTNRGFAFDSSIVAPESKTRFTKFANLMLGLKERDEAAAKRFPPCAVFGHADPTGKDDYNKTLSGRRALAVYAVLTRKVEIWDDLFLNAFGGDKWGTKAIQTILSIPLGDGESAFYAGPVDGAKTAETQKQTKDAVLAYKKARHMIADDSSDATLNPTQRHQLFKDYMDTICQDEDGNPFSLQPTDFIAKGKGKKSLKGDVMGCGEFNPIFLLSKAADDLAAKNDTLAAVRNELYAVDRRALVFIFQYGTEIDPQKWPCPIARDDANSCTKRFWSDHPKRRMETDQDRTFGENMPFLIVGDDNTVVPTPIEQTGNTMACRFYHAFAVNSPCEAKFKEWVVRIKVPSFNGGLLALKNRRYVVKVGESANSPVIRGTTDDNGVIRIPMFDEKTHMSLLIDAARDLTNFDDEQPSDSDAVDESKFLPVELDGGTLHPRDPQDDLAVKQRLYNYGFGEHDPATWSDGEFKGALLQFRRAARRPNASDEETRQLVMIAHDLAGVPDSPDDPNNTDDPNSGSPGGDSNS